MALRNFREKKRGSTAVESNKKLAEEEIGNAGEQPIRSRLMRVQRGREGKSRRLYRSLL